MTKHTQAPWEIMPSENLPPRIKSKSFGIICRLNDIFPTENGYQENKANARLIAAAPELLEALAMMVAMVNRTKLENLSEVKYACEVIAKARGE